MTFDLKKAMDNGGKCICYEYEDGVRSICTIVDTGFKRDCALRVLAVIHGNDDKDSRAISYTYSGEATNSRLENVPKSREVFIAVTDHGVLTFDSFEYLDDYCESICDSSSKNIISTSKIKITDGEFIDND